MSDLADAHIHLFEQGFQGSFNSRGTKATDEVSLYNEMAREHHLKKALVVGYEGDSWARGNNDYLAKIVSRHQWIAPAAYVHLDQPVALSELEKRKAQRFVGISLYVFGDANVNVLKRIPDEVWAWLERHRWLVSLNSRGKEIASWAPLLARHPKLTLLISHLGLPPRVSKTPSPAESRAAMKDVVDLARFSNVHVKLSGFYALGDPGYDYLYQNGWPYVVALREAYTAKRLLWGSDFTPSLDRMTYPQTYALLVKMDFFTDEDRHQIMSENLLGLLKAIPTP